MMRSRLTIAFLQNLKNGKANINEIATKTSCTPGQLLDFIKYLISCEIVKLSNGEIELIDNGEKFANFKKLNVSVVKTFKTQEIKSICEKLNETLFSIVNYLYHNEAAIEENIQNALPLIKNLNYSLAVLTKLKVVSQVGEEYYCALGATDFKVISQEMAAKGITLDKKEQDLITVDICFNDLVLTEQVDCLKTPSAILCDIYFNTVNVDIKRKLMMKNLNLFAKYKTAINLKESEFALLRVEVDDKIELDFDIPLANQIPTQIKMLKARGKKLKFSVFIKLNGAH